MFASARRTKKSCHVVARLPPAAAAPYAEAQLDAAQQASNELRTAFFDAISRASEVRKSAMVCEIDYNEALQKKTSMEAMLRSAKVSKGSPAVLCTRL